MEMRARVLGDEVDDDKSEPVDRPEGLWPAPPRGAAASCKTLRMTVRPVHTELLTVFLNVRRGTERQ